MKKAAFFLTMVCFSLFLYSCRETTKDKTEEAIEAIGEDIEEGAERAGEKIEEGAEKMEREIDEEINETDDINNRKDNSI